MSLLGRLLHRRIPPPERAARSDASRTEPAAANVPAEPSPQARALARLTEAGSPGGPDADELVALFRALRGTEHESSALVTITERRALCPEPLVVAAAELAHARGEGDVALALLDGARSVPALVLAADLLAERGELARAISTIERVLARDIDAPGARERHDRWSERLGRRRRDAAGRDDATLVTASPGGTSLRILREVARGGAGVVYEAEDELLGRRVAYKVHHRPRETRDQLLREACVAAALGGPGVVRVFDASPDAGFLVLEWVARGSLRDALRAGATELLLPVDRWAWPLARALARVHSAGWVHADLKPANVLLRAPDDPILSDFGIARRPGEASLGGSSGYVSAERLAGAPISPSDDVFAFGRVLDQVLDATSGRSPPPAAWRRAAAACLASATGRPRDGAALSAILP